LSSLNFSEDFEIYSFSPHDTIVAILMQKNASGHELSILFISVVLKDYKLYYTLVKKIAYTLVKAMSNLRPYILTTHIVAYNARLLVKMFLNKQELGGHWA
jgi:hypothetical protein